MARPNAELDAALNAFSEGRAARSDIAAAAGRPVSFGQVLALLAEKGLPLPRFPSDPSHPGRALLRASLARAARRAKR